MSAYIPPRPLWIDRLAKRRVDKERNRMVQALHEAQMRKLEQDIEWSRRGLAIKPYQESNWGI